MDEPIEAGDWSIFLKKPSNSSNEQNYLEAIIRLKSNPNKFAPIENKEIEELEMDLKDLGKWRKFKELKKDLRE